MQDEMRAFFLWSVVGERAKRGALPFLVTDPYTV
jgi:hypothetical protein